jgi:hypothetical protein
MKYASGYNVTKEQAFKTLKVVHEVKLDLVNNPKKSKRIRQ